jgi:glycosyltransferase involved in cell wall biosynthesis
MDGPIRVALVGGVPPTLGGGGLETQVAATRAALERRGHEAFLAARQDEPRPFDVLHAIGAELDVCAWLAHWRRNPAPLVVSPVLVVAPGRERLELVAARVPLRSYGPRLRADLLRRADLAVAQTAHEEGLLRRLGARATTVVPNGVTPVAPTAPPAGTPETPYVLMLGSVSARKRQAETVAALPAGLDVVVAGGFDGTAAERAAFERAVATTGATWLGEVRDPGAVRALLRDARALVHLSSAEGQALALLEALREGTPVIVSPLPANRELAARHPDHVRIVDGPEGVAAALAELEHSGSTPKAPAIPTWDDVAVRLEEHYRAVVGA